MAVQKRKKLVHGVGVNDADYVVESYEVVGGKPNKKACPFYSTWKGMLRRCYSETYLSKHPSYKGSQVCDEWLRFSNFRAWMVEQDWKDENGNRLCLDKDLLSGTNRGKLYSPQTCLFVSNALNSFLVFQQSTNSGLPSGVTWHKGFEKYRATVNDPFTGKYEHLGYFTTPEAASAAYRKCKKELASRYARIVTDPRLKQILLDFEVPVNLTTTSTSTTGTNNV